MSYEETMKMLHDNGWDLDCWSPLEISLQEDDGSSRASGYAAQLIINMIEESCFESVEILPPEKIAAE